jgi:geranylgeranyl diphosphate synthase type I
MGILQKYLPEIEEELGKIIQEPSPKYKGMYDMMRYFLGWQDEKGNHDPKARGKRFRPTLSLLVCESICGKYKHALPAAAAIELFHNFTLIHDDIEDHDEYRRHKKTVWKIWGIEQAINTGDAMLILSELAALAAISSQRLAVSSEKKLQIIEALNQAFLKVIEGQFLDIEFEKRTDVTVEEYLEVNMMKTAELVSGACKVGAILATNDQKMIDLWREFGLNFGLAYQIYDDVCSIWEKEENTGKREAGDIREKKKTLPILYALDKLDAKDKEKIIEIYRKEELNDDDINKVINLLDKVNAKDYTMKIALDYRQKTLDVLKKIEIDNEIKDEFFHLVELLIK